MINISKKKCTGCSACYNICPYNCIEMIEDEEGFKYPIVDAYRCKKCKLCIKVCPAIKSQISSEANKDIYVAFSKDQDVVESSSSGGLFTELAKIVLKNNGKVYGAAFNKNNELNHISVEIEEELDKIRKSKYVQSNINDSFKKVKEDLLNDKSVLFCGTPCQISGLRNYLGKDYENLILVDFICHGVPSQKMFFKYLEYIKKSEEEESQIKKIDFRSKDCGWENFSIKIEFESGHMYVNNSNEDYWLKSFLQDILLRPSCYNCNNKGINRDSDITIADAWNIKAYIPEMYNERGTSLVIVHSKKGQAILKEIENKINISVSSEDYVRTHNVNAYYSAISDRRRNKFFDNIIKGNKDFKTSVENSIHISIFTRVERKIKKQIKLYNFTN